MATIHDHMIAQKRQEWRSAGVPSSDIDLALKSGIDARDLSTLRQFTHDRGLIIVIRCPNAAAVVWHGILPAKTWATKKKTGDSGAVAREQGSENWSDEQKAAEKPQPRRAMVSDYDLMSIWKRNGGGFEKVFVSPLPLGSPRGNLPPASRDLVRDLNGELISRIQHGCQDDWWNVNNPGVKGTDRFTAVHTGSAEFLPHPADCQRYYASRGLSWPYNAAGQHEAAAPR